MMVFTATKFDVSYTYLDFCDVEELEVWWSGILLCGDDVFKFGGRQNIIGTTCFPYTSYIYIRPEKKIK